MSLFSVKNAKDLEFLDKGGKIGYYYDKYRKNRKCF